MSDIDLTDVEEAVALVEAMRAEGKDESEIDHFMQRCREFSAEVMIQELRDQGVPEAEIVAFIEDISSKFIDDDESYSVDDEGNYV